MKVSHTHPIERMRKSGALTEADYLAFRQIELAMMMLARTESVGNKLEAYPRYSYHRSEHTGRDLILEQLGRVAITRIFHKWAKRVPAPRRMHIDMIIGNTGFVDMARKYEVDWRTARKRFAAGLQLWTKLVTSEIG
jgi:hypothetical protein